jgi:competence protein ComEC
VNPTLHHHRALVLVTLALSFGVIADRLFPLPLAGWTFAGILLTLLAINSQTVRVPAILLATIALGGGWHADRQRLWNVDDIAGFASEQVKLCRLKGIVVGDVIQMAPNQAEASLARKEEVRTRFTLRVTDLVGTSNNVNGQVIVHLAGMPGPWRAGSHLSVIGWLARPREPLNRGESPYADFLRDQHIGAILFTEETRSVTDLGHGSWMTVGYVRDAVRDWARQAIHTSLSSTSAPLAEAFLLGIRSALAPSDVLPFIESGTVHVLVVSGLHVALVSHLFWSLASIVVRSVAWRSWATMAFVLIYTLITGANPPAIRAAVASLLILGQFIGKRSADPISVLAASACAILLLDPGDLFRTGPQLSFLCAMAILVLLPSPPTETREDSVSIGLAGRLGKRFQQLLVGCIVLWLVTAPLLASQFHLFSPISVLASVALVPLSEWTLGIGMAFLMLAIVPGAEVVLAPLLEASMQLLSGLSQWAASAEWGSLYVPGPHPIWVGGWYAIFLFPWIIPGNISLLAPLRRCHVGLCLIWLGIGLIGELLPQAGGTARYHQLAVGHGNAGIYRTTENQTLLFDVGSVAGPEVADRVVAPWLWNQRISHLDAVFLSHPDIDHFNGLGRLARRFAIDQVYLGPSFLQSTEPGALLILDELWRRQIPIRLLHAGQSLKIGQTIVRCLHPPIGFRGGNDNADSLVLSIEEDGRAILLTGDVESDGLNRLMKLPAILPVVLIAPHHGSAASNTPPFAQWCQPKLVVSSQGVERRRSDTLAVYRERGARTLATDTAGEVEVTLKGEGFQVRTFRPTVGFEQIPRP